MRTLSILSVCLGLAPLLGIVTANVRAAELKAGDAAPDFQLQGSDGKTYKLSDFKSKKPVVLAWFPKAFTGGWTAECKSLRESGDALRKFDVAYFAASVDPMEGDKGNKAFAESLKADYPILSDPTKATANAYGVVPEGRAAAQRWTFYIGKDGKILHIDKMVKAAEHGQEVVTRLKELGVPEKK